jgi:type VI protein secretion system component Hcp
MIAPRCPHRAWLLLLALLVLLHPADSRAAVFIKFEDIPGELTSGPYAGWTAVQTAGAQAFLPVDPTNNTAGPAVLSCELHKAFDRTSPLLLQKCALGERLPRVTLDYTLPEPQATRFRLTLTNVLVESVNQGIPTNAPSTGGQERIRLNFDRIELACLELDSRGGVAGGLTGFFDQPANEGGLKTRPPFRVTLTRAAGTPGLQVTWPAEGGHRYRVLSRAPADGSWTPVLEATAIADGPLSRSLPSALPSLFLRVEEID